MLIYCKLTAKSAKLQTFTNITPYNTNGFPHTIKTGNLL